MNNWVINRIQIHTISTSGIVFNEVPPNRVCLDGLERVMEFLAGYSGAKFSFVITKCFLV